MVMLEVRRSFLALTAQVLDCWNAVLMNGLYRHWSVLVGIGIGNISNFSVRCGTGAMDECLGCWPMSRRTVGKEEIPAVRYGVSSNCTRVCSGIPCQRRDAVDSMQMRLRV